MEAPQYGQITPEQMKEEVFRRFLADSHCESLKVYINELVAGQAEAKPEPPAAPVQVETKAAASTEVTGEQPD